MNAVAAVVEDGKVINMIIVEVDDAGKTDFSIEGLDLVVLPEESPVTFGYTYDGTNFTAPPEPVEPE